MTTTVQDDDEHGKAAPEFGRERDRRPVLLVEGVAFCDYGVPVIDQPSLLLQLEAVRDDVEQPQYSLQQHYATHSQQSLDNEKEGKNKTGLDESLLDWMQFHFYAALVVLLVIPIIFLVLQVDDWAFPCVVLMTEIAYGYLVFILHGTLSRLGSSTCVKRIPLLVTFILVASATSLWSDSINLLLVLVMFSCFVLAIWQCAIMWRGPSAVQQYSWLPIPWTLWHVLSVMRMRMVPLLEPVPLVFSLVCLCLWLCNIFYPLTRNVPALWTDTKHFINTLMTT